MGLDTDRLAAIFAESIAAHQQVHAQRPRAAAARGARDGGALAAGRTVLVFGNGGSASDAQHLVADSWDDSKSNGVRWRRWR